MARPSAERLALYSALLREKGLATPRAGAIPRRTDAARAPLSFAQERLYFLELYEPGTALYNDAVRVDLEGELDRDALERALARLVERHEILRTSLALENGGPVQRIHPSCPGPWTVTDLAHDVDSAARVTELAREEAGRPFELETAPLWRLRLFVLGRAHHVLVLTMHHLVSDGASMGVFFDDLSVLYALESGTSERELQPLAFQFGDYAAHERATYDGSREEEHLAYWRAALAGELPSAAWPGARGPAHQRGGQIPLAFSQAFTTRLEHLARAQGLTTNQLALAAWFVLLGAASGLDDLRTGFAGSLRHRRGLEQQIGFFVQSLVLRATTRPEQEFLALARELGQRTLAALAHEALPWDRVVRALERRDGPSLAPVFFSHMRDAIRVPRLGAAHARFAFVDPGVARFELALILHEGAEGITGFLEYDEQRIARASAEALAADYGALLARVLALPEARLDELARLVRVRTSSPRRAPLPLPIRARKAQ